MYLLNLVQEQGRDNMQPGQGTNGDKGTDCVAGWTVPKVEIAVWDCVGSHNALMAIRYNHWFRKQHEAILKRELAI